MCCLRFFLLMLLLNSGCFRSREAPRDCIGGNVGAQTPCPHHRNAISSAMVKGDGSKATSQFESFFSQCIFSPLCCTCIDASSKRRRLDVTHKSLLFSTWSFPSTYTHGNKNGLFPNPFYFCKQIIFSYVCIKICGCHICIANWRAKSMMAFSVLRTART